MDTSKKPSECVLLVQAGQSFDIVLESMVGSTGYGWCLKNMPPEIVLISTFTTPIHAGVSPVRQGFTLGAIKSCRCAQLEFEMLCLFDLLREPADYATYPIEIYEPTSDDALKNEIGSQKFLNLGGTMVHNRPVPPYGFANPDKIHVLYGFPPPEACSPTVIASTKNCLLKYGNPFGVATEESDCRLKYGYPAPKYGYPPSYKYGFPLTNAAGKTLVVKENPLRCLVKYGTPYGVANKADECLLKYGFPEAPSN